jgi:hypothetical protein
MLSGDYGRALHLAVIPDLGRTGVALDQERLGSAASRSKDGQEQEAAEENQSLRTDAQSEAASISDSINWTG